MSVCGLVHAAVMRTGCCGTHSNADQPPCAAQVALSINCMSVCGLVHAAVMRTGCCGTHSNADQPPCAAQVALSINCMSVCGLVHAAVMKTGKLYVAEAEEAEFLGRARRFALQCAP